MALERVPADIRQDGGVARMSDPEMIVKIKKAVTIPVMAKARRARSRRPVAPRATWPAVRRAAAPPSGTSPPRGAPR